jgi:hypothetical protein
MAVRGIMTAYVVSYVIDWRNIMQATSNIPIKGTLIAMVAILAARV